MDNASIIITLDIDELLFDKIQQMLTAEFAVVELNTSDTALLSRVKEHFPTIRLGAGNIIDTQQLEQCYQANVDFITSPGFMPALAQTASIYSINYLPGVATISEAMQAMSLGCRHVRPYPANLTFCTLLNKCLPLLRLFPAEIEWEEAEHFFNLPSVAAVSVLNPDNKQLPVLEAV